MSVDTDTPKSTCSHDESPTRPTTHPVRISTARVMLSTRCCDWARRLFARRARADRSRRRYRRDFYFEESAMAREMHRL